MPEIFKVFKEVYQYYLNHGLHIITVHADDEFGPLKILIEPLLGGPLLNLSASNEHFSDIKRQVRVVKECCRSIRHGFPFQQMPKLLTTRIVLNKVKMLKINPTKGGISDSLSPKTIMSGYKLDFSKHLLLQLVQYCQVHEKESPHNIQAPRTKGAICISPSGNLQGRYKFMALN